MCRCWALRAPPPWALRAPLPWALRAPPPCALQASVPVDVMPGEFDPTNYTLPQQPLHPCMFPLATAYSTLQLVTNPYQATIDGVR